MRNRVLLLLSLVSAGCSSQTTSPMMSSEASARSPGRGHGGSPSAPTNGGIGDGTVAADGAIGGVALASNRNLGLGRPQRANGEDEVLISRNQYAISWNAAHRELNWSAWQLVDGDVGTSGRSNSFMPDPDLAAYLGAHGGGAAVDAADYQGSCFDRGHQTPSGDRTDAAADNRFTFYMSNMIPQTAYLNRVIWEHLEEYERSLVKGSGTSVFIVAGPIFSGAARFIGPNHDIEVPNKNFKIIASKDGGSVKVIAAVIMPNVTSTGSDPVDDHDQACKDSKGSGADAETISTGATANDWQKYTASISEIESESGLDLSYLTGN